MIRTLALFLCAMIAACSYPVMNSSPVDKNDPTSTDPSPSTNPPTVEEDAAAEGGAVAMHDAGVDSAPMADAAVSPEDAADAAPFSMISCGLTPNWAPVYTETYTSPSMFTHAGPQAFDHLEYRAPASIMYQRGPGTCARGVACRVYFDAVSYSDARCL
jgi:hypothetical protein